MQNRPESSAHDLLACPAHAVYRAEGGAAPGPGGPALLPSGLCAPTPPDRAPVALPEGQTGRSSLVEDLDRLIQATATLLADLEIHFPADDGRPAFRAAHNAGDSA